MGDSASAHIGFGFKLLKDEDTGEYPEPLSDIWDIDNVYVKKMGLVMPEYDRVCSGPIWDKYREDFKRIWNEAGVVIKSGGYGQDEDQTEYYLLVTESHVAFDWEQETVFKPEQLIEKPHWRDLLKNFCEFMAIEHHEPQMMGFVYYG